MTRASRATCARDGRAACGWGWRGAGIGLVPAVGLYLSSSGAETSCGRARATHEPVQRLEAAGRASRDAVTTSSRTTSATLGRRDVGELLDENLVEGPRPRGADGLRQLPRGLVAAQRKQTRTQSGTRRFGAGAAGGGGAASRLIDGAAQGQVASCAATAAMQARKTKTVVAAVDGRLRGRLWWRRGGLGVGEGPERAAGGHRLVQRFGPQRTPARSRSHTQRSAGSQCTVGR